MRLTRRFDNNPAGVLFSEMDRLIRQSLRGVPVAEADRGSRGFSIYEADDAWHLRAELPGIRKEDLEITIEDDVLKVNAERAGGGRGFVESFSESLRVPEDVQRTAITASLAHGVLDLTLPKSEPVAPKTLRITVK